MNLSHALSVGSLVLLFTAPALAHRPVQVPVHLQYTVVPGAALCPSEEQLRYLVRTHLGYDPFRPDAPLRIAVVISRRGSELVAGIAIHDDASPSITREEIKLPATPCSCWNLVSAIALSMAVTLTRVPEPDPPAPAPPRGPRRAEPARPPPAGALPPASSMPPHCAEAPAASLGSSSRPPAVQVGAGGLGSLAPSSRFTFGAAGFVGLRWPGASITLEGRGVFPAESEGEDNREFQVTPTAGVLAPCLHHSVLFGCALLELGVLRVDSRELDIDQKSYFLFAAGIRAGLEVPLVERLALRGYADLLAAPITSTVRFDYREVWTSAPIAGVFGLGLSASF